MVETGCWCWVPGAGAGAGSGGGAGAVSWLCTWWREVAGCWCWVPGAGAGAVAVRVVETGARGGDRLLVPVLVLGAGAGAVSWLCTWWRKVGGAGAGYRVLVLVL